MKSHPNALAVKSSTQQAPYVTSPIMTVSTSANLLKHKVHDITQEIDAYLNKVLWIKAANRQNIRED